MLLKIQARARLKNVVGEDHFVLPVPSGHGPTQPLARPFVGRVAVGTSRRGAGRVARGVGGQRLSEGGERVVIMRELAFQEAVLE